MSFHDFFHCEESFKSFQKKNNIVLVVLVVVVNVSVQVFRVLFLSSLNCDGVSSFAIYCVLLLNNFPLPHSFRHVSPYFCFILLKILSVRSSGKHDQ